MMRRAQSKSKQYYSYYTPEIANRDLQLMDNFCKYMMYEIQNALSSGYSHSSFFVVQPTFDVYDVCG
jgi:hypothetical protein